MNSLVLSRLLPSMAKLPIFPVFSFGGDNGVCVCMSVRQSCYSASYTAFASFPFPPCCLILSSNRHLSRLAAPSPPLPALFPLFLSNSKHIFLITLFNGSLLSRHSVSSPGHPKPLLSRLGGSLLEPKGPSQVLNEHGCQQLLSPCLDSLYLSHPARSPHSRLF